MSLCINTYTTEATVVIIIIFKFVWVYKVSEKSRKYPSKFPKGDIFSLLVLSNQQSKIQRCCIY